jgi:hypothetical protein
MLDITYYKIDNLNDVMEVDSIAGMDVNLFISNDLKEFLNQNINLYILPNGGDSEVEYNMHYHKLNKEANIAERKKDYETCFIIWYNILVCRFTLAFELQNMDMPHLNAIKYCRTEMIKYNNNMKSIGKIYNVVNLILSQVDSYVNFSQAIYDNTFTF